MQLTVGKDLTVYNLDEKDRYEVALVSRIDNFDDNPIVFGATGFFQLTPNRHMVCNRIHTLGLQQFDSDKARRGLMRAFSEIDLFQVVSINEKIIAGEASQSDLGDIETETFMKSIFREETFFSLFAEQKGLYDLIY